MIDDVELWYVRHEGKVTGPFSRTEIEKRRKRDVLKWSDDVSQDRIFWLSASALPRDGEAVPARRNRRRSGLFELVTAMTAAAACLGLWWLVPSEPEPEALEQIASEPVALLAPDPAPVPATVPQPPPAPAPQPVPPSEPTKTPKPPAPLAKRERSPLSRAVRSPEADAELSTAVGFVVCGRSCEADDGTKTELPKVTGTCFAVSEQGHLLTNRHVVEWIGEYRDSDERKDDEKKFGMKIEPVIWVFFKAPGKKLEKRQATVVYQTDPQDEIDVAVLKIDTGQGPLPYHFRLAASGSEVRIKSREVWSLGYPAAARLPIYGKREDPEKVKRGTKVEEFFAESDFEYVSERGIVNVVRKESGKRRPFVDCILHGARISAGNSGGPLITKDATVVGINTLTQRFEKDGITNYFALGMTQIEEVLAKHVPEFLPDRAEPAKPAAEDDPE